MTISSSMRHSIIRHLWIILNLYQEALSKEKIPRRLKILKNAAEEVEEVLVRLNAPLP